MRTGLIRRVVSLFVAAMMVSLVAAPAVSADTNVAPVVTAPADQTFSSLQAAPYGGYCPYSLGAFLDPAGAAGGPWQWTIAWGDDSAGAGTATTQGALSSYHRYLPGTYQAHVVVTNAAGLSSDAYFNVTVAGDLVVGFNTPYQAATEGIATTITYAYYDPYPSALLDPLAVHLNWGDGTLSDFSANYSSGTILSGSHTYAAGDRTSPSAPVTIYTATATVTDSQGHSGSASLAIGAYDVAPKVTALPVIVPAGFHGLITLATFTDASLGPWYINIDGGPGFQLQEQVAAPGPIQVQYNGLMGSRSVTVSVGDRGWLSTTVVTPITVVNPGPIVTGVHFTPSPAMEGTAVAVVGTYTQAGDYPVTCSVDYGDGSVLMAGSLSNGQCYGPAHLYRGLGPYTATVSVTNPYGVGTGQATLTLPNDPPAITSVLLPTSAMPYEAVFATTTFTDRGMGTSETYVCTVDFGDGSGPEAASVHGSNCQGVHGYEQTGTYTVTVRVTDSNGGVAVRSMPISVYLDSPVVNHISAPATTNIGEPIAASATFLPTGHDETYSCTVDYSDGTGPLAGVIVGSTCEGPSHVYTLSGGMTIEVVVTGSLSGSGSNAVDIIVFQPSPSVDSIWAETTLDEGSSTTAGANFTPTGHDETYTCTIDYGDGSGSQVGLVANSACIGPNHTYADPGTFTITLTVTGSGGTSGSASRPIEVANLGPVVSAGSFYSYGPSGQDDTVTVTFTDPGLGASGSTETYTCTIDYGDGGGPQGGTIAGNTCSGPNHAYASKGTYPMAAAVSDSNGGVGTYSLPITIYNPVPIVGPVFAPDTVTIPSAVAASASFISTGQDQAETCTVDYGDGTGPAAGLADGSNCQGPSHLYASPGTYKITVLVVAPLGMSSSSKAIAVVYPPLAVNAVSLPNSIVEGAAVVASTTFTPTSVHQTYTCTVDYGDNLGAQAGVVSGKTCTGPKHVFGRPGQFAVALTVKGSSGATGSATKTISVTNVVPTFTKVTIPTTVKLGSTASVSATFSDPGTAESYQAVWTWGDGTTTTILLGAGVRSFAASHSYAKSGAYSVNAALSDGGDTVYYNSGTAVYDPARTLSSSGSAVSPKGACLLTRACGVAGTAGFSIRASYAKNATKPTVNLAYSVTGISVTANSADYFVAVNGTALIHGTCSVNGKASYNYTVWLVDGKPDSLSLFVYDASGNWVYYTDPAPLKAGSITIK